jgi:hypothetical protein
MHFQICDKADDFPDSIISKGSVDDDNIIIYENNTSKYGKVRIGLHPTHEYGHQLNNFVSCDAAIGLNSGIGSYNTWCQTLTMLVQHDIPFAFSDHSICSVNGITEITIPHLDRLLKSRGMHIRFNDKTYNTKLNPFHCPVARDIGVMILPNVNKEILVVLLWLKSCYVRGLNKDEVDC